LRISHVGSYWMEAGYFLNLWCRDQGTRSAAALERAAQALPHWTRRDEVGEQLARLCQQLEVPEVGIRDLRAHLRRNKRDDLLGILDGMASEPDAG